LCSAASWLIRWIRGEIYCEGGNWIELAQNRVEWQSLVLAVLKNLCVLLPESYLNSKMDLREMSCEGGRWIELAQERVQWQSLVLSVLNLQCSAVGDFCVRHISFILVSTYLYLVYSVTQFTFVPLSWTYKQFDPVCES